jgi:hypothetical protein
MGIYVPLIPLVIGAPHLVQQRISRPRPARLRCKQIQYLKLQGRQVHALASAKDLVPPFVDNKFADFNSLAFFRGLKLTATSKQRFNSNLEFTRTERLCKIVVSACRKAGVNFSLTL